MLTLCSLSLENPPRRHRNINPMCSRKATGGSPGFWRQLRAFQTARPGLGLSGGSGVTHGTQEGSALELTPEEAERTGCFSPVRP